MPGEALSPSLPRWLLPVPLLAPLALLAWLLLLLPVVAPLEVEEVPVELALEFFTPP